MNKSKKKSWVDKVFGEVCECGVRHINVGTPGENLPKSVNSCKKKK